MKSMRLITLFLLVIPIFFSCSKSKDKIIVAKIADREITLKRYETAYKNVDVQFLPTKSGFEGLREFLDTMINKEVMAVKADELGYDKDPVVVQGMKLFKNMGLQAAYLKFKVADKVKVTEDDLKTFYSRMGVMLSIKQMLLDTEDEAENVYQMLKDGNDFDTLLKRYSKAPDAVSGGKVLTAAFGNFAPEFQNEVFSLSIGEFSRPVSSPYGYFIVKVLGKQRQKPRPYEEIKESLEEMVRGYAQMVQLNLASEEIQRKAGVQWHLENVKIIFDALPPDRPLTNPPAKGSSDDKQLKFPTSIQNDPVVTYKKKTISLQDFADLYNKASFFNRPRREFRLGGIKRFLVEIMMNELVMDEMEASNMEEMPEVKKVLDSKTEELMINKMYDELIQSQVSVTDRETNDYYENNIDFFSVPERRSFGVVLTGDKGTAEEAFSKMSSGESFISVVDAYSIDESTKRNRGQTDFLTQGSQPELDQVGFGLKKIGEISQPFQTSRGWVILKLIERQKPRVLPLSEAGPAAQKAVKNMKLEALFNKKLESWKKELHVEVFEDNLRKADLQERSKDSEEITPARPKRK